MFSIFWLFANGSAHAEKAPSSTFAAVCSWLYSFTGWKSQSASDVSRAVPESAPPPKSRHSVDGYIPTNRNQSRLIQDGIPQELIEPAGLVGKKVADIGSGAGAYVDELVAAGVDAVGVDKNPRSGAKNVIKGNARNLPLASGEYDVVFCHWSIFTSMYERNHSTANLVKVLNEFSRVLRPGGVIRMGPGLRNARLDELLKEVPHLKVVRRFRDGPYHSSYVEIQKVSE